MHVSNQWEVMRDACKKEERKGAKGLTQVVSAWCPPDSGVASAGLGFCSQSHSGKAF